MMYTASAADVKLLLAELEKQKLPKDEPPYSGLEKLAKIYCRPLCDDVCRILPREIRDIIYSYVHSHDTIYVGPEYISNRGQPCESDRGAHYWDAEFVGKEMRNEIVESWYRSTLFFFYDQANNARVVDQFLVLDRWELGLKPRDYICRVRFNLGASGHLLHGDVKCQGPQLGQLRCMVIGLAEVLTNPLQNMRQLPNHVHFFIRIHTYRSLEFRCLIGEELERTVETLVKDLKSLSAAGHRWVVQWSELSDLEFRSRSGVYDVDLWMKEIEEASIRARQQ
ncbi:hypothetical protein BKA66DRAFT_454273 [Pyrenochaeta sp. MPI-SDFR-AT-0127]|nr:hypothetical protein BKA66DRAFT_454273 [Pyrenochaeta sp. MPI-SDFR-AT-0127]